MLPYATPKTCTSWIRNVVLSLVAASAAISSGCSGSNSGGAAGSIAAGEVGRYSGFVIPEGSQRGIAVADFNNDGIDDLVFSSKTAEDGGSSSTIGLIFGGALEALRTLPASRKINLEMAILNLDAADMDGDGAMDILAVQGHPATADPEGVTVLYGDGSGAFPVRVFLPTVAPSGVYSYDTAVDDFNGDGIQDIVVAIRILDESSVFLGTGGRNFASRSRLIQGGSSPGPLLAVETADVNGDGVIDIVGSGTGPITFFAGHGDGTFENETVLDVADAENVSASAAALNAVDFNRDGLTDLFRAPELFLNQGGGSFEHINLLAAQGIDLPASGLRGPTIADLNGDGLPDMVLGIAQDVLQVLVNDGNATFSVLEEILLDHHGDLALGDWTGDGILDLARMRQFDLRIVPGLAGGHFDFEQTTSLDTDYEFTYLGYFVALGDFDGDGDKDAATDGGPHKAVSVYENEGQGRFGAGRALFLGDSLKRLAAADVNGDGIDDLIIATGTNGISTFNALQVFLGGSGMVFQELSPFPLAQPFDRQMHMANLDGNSSADLLLTANLPFENGGSIYPLLGQLDGTFATSDPIHLAFNSRLETAGDLDGDGFTDLVWTGSIDADLHAVFGDGNGGVGPETVIPIQLPDGLTNNRIFTGDFNGDGSADLLLTSNLDAFLAGEAQCLVLLNDGDASFTKISNPYNDLVYGVAAPGDVNGDGFTDDVTISISAGFRLRDAFALRLSHGDGTFGPAKLYPFGNNGSTVWYEDLDANGAPDLISTYGDGLAVLFGNPPESAN